MKSQILFFDIDGTLYLPWLGLSPKVENALKVAKERGHKLFLCTGRTLIGIPQEILQIGFDGIIGSAGASIQIGSKVVEENGIKPQDLSILRKELDRLEIAYELETNQGTFYSDKMFSLCEKYRDDASNNSEMARLTCGKDFSIMHPINEFHSGIFAAKVAFLSENPEPMDELKKVLPQTCRMIIFGTAKDGATNGEIMPKDVDKGKAVLRVCELLGHDSADTIGFGDSYNDLEMLHICGKSVVMEDADYNIKEDADYVCPSIKNDGVYHAMKTLGLC